MFATDREPYLTPEAYLQQEASSPVKHEYRDGHAYAMAGANDAHVTITGNLFALLRSHVRGSGCRVYLTDMKAQLPRGRQYYYPDLMVTCDSRDQATDTYKCFPKLVVEVLSDSTEAFDRGDKFIDYQTLESLQEYALINTRRRRIECFRRTDSGLWLLQSYTPESESFELKSVGFAGTIAALYEDVDLTEPPPKSATQAN